MIPPSDWTDRAVSLKGARLWNGRTSWDLAMITVLCVVGAALFFRAVQEERWSGWALGDAQTLLTMRHWATDGILAHYALFVGQGYSVATQYLDEPSLRHHAHGIAPGSSPNVGPRLHYTHYPPGYLFPYAAMMKTGWNHPAAFRVLAMSFSLAAVGLMYLVFSQITSPAIGCLASLYYLTSAMFLKYADALANQPLDDFLRFLFMWVTLAEVRAETPALRNFCGISAWTIVVCLSLSSYDSVLFLLVWTVGFDLLIGRGVRLRRWVGIAIAPLLAFCLQFMQNVWYLGGQDAVRDLWDTFAGGTAPRTQRRIMVIWGEVASMIGQSVILKLALVPVLVLLWWLYTRGIREYARLYPLFLLLFGLAGCAFAVVLPTAGGMFYQGRQFAPLISLLVGGLTAWSLDVLFRGKWPGLSLFGKVPLPRGGIALLVATVFLLWSGSVWASLGAWDIPPGRTGFDHMTRVNQEDLTLARMLREPAGSDRVIFNVQGFTDHLISYVPGYPQIHPVYEYIADALILSFDSPEAVVEDLLRLWKRSEFRFAPILVSRSSAQVQTIAKMVLTALNSQQAVPSPQLVHGRYVLNLPYPSPGVIQQRGRHQ